MAKKLSHRAVDDSQARDNSGADEAHWSTIAIRNSRLLIMIIGILLVGGLSSYSVLPRMEDPVLVPRAAMITTLYPVADAEQVEALVTDRIEKAIKEVEAIKEINSQSRSGVSVISIELRDDVYESATVWSKIRGKVEDAIPLLPPEASRPEFEDLRVRAFAWIGGLVWRGEGEPNYAILRRFAEDLEDRVRGLSGTDDVEQFGAPQEEILVAIDPSTLAAMGMSAADVAERVQANDARNSAGAIRSSGETLPIELGNQLQSVAAVRQLPIQSDSNGNFVMLGDVAQIDRIIADPPGELGWVDGRPAVLVGALVRNNSRIDRWQAALDTTVAEFRDSLPPAIELNVILEQNNYVQTRLSELVSNLALGALAVLGGVWLLMGWRNAIMVSTALPLVSLAVLAGMRVLEIPIHQMSVAGLIIALGLLIDNAIVIVDSVSSQLRKGKTPAAAVGATGRILAIPLFASTLTTAFAFAPIYLMEGPAGEFVGSMALNVMLAVGSSLLISLIVIAPLAAVLNQLGQQKKNSDRPAGLRPGFLRPVFERFVCLAVRFPKTNFAVWLAITATGFFSLTQLPEQFFPPADRDQFYVELDMPTNASFEETQLLASAVGREMREHPRVAQTTWLLGRSVPTFYYNVIPRRKNARDYAQAIVQIDSPEKSRELINELQIDLQSKFPQARILVRQLEQGPPFDAPIEVRFFGPDLDVLRELGQRCRQLVSSLPNVVHTRTELNDASPTLEVNVSTEEARLIGLQPSGVAQQLSAQLDGVRSGFVLQATEQIPVRIRVGNASRASLADIESLDLVQPNMVQPNDSNISSNETSTVPLAAISEIKLKPNAATVNRLNGVRMQEVQAFLTAGTLPSTVLTDLQQALQSSEWQLPDGYRVEFGGEASKRNEAVGNLMASVGVLVAAMIATLVLSIGSFRGSLIIGLVAIMAVSFGGTALFWFGYPFGFMAIVGIMGLIGVAINDSIVVLTALRSDPEAASGDEEAILHVVMHETRHILATTLTTIVGFLPLILAGGGFWPPMAVAIAGGVVGCTALALIFVPSAFGWLAKRKCSTVEAIPTLTTAVDAPESDSVPSDVPSPKLPHETPAAKTVTA